MKTKILSILALLLTVTQGAWAQTLPTDGTGAYTIGSKANWETFCTDVSNGITYSGQTVKLTQNVGPVTTIAGSEAHPFSGTFDGQGNTLTVSISVSNDYMHTPAAPFAAIGGATIQNLHVAGSISSNCYRPAGIASNVTDDSEITNCKSSVSITASRNNDLDAGGFVGAVYNGKALTMTGCTFAGSITYSDANGYEGGGMVSWTRTGATATLTDCVFAPTSVSFANSKSKADNNFRMLVGGIGSSTLTRCYYNDVAANNTKIITDGEGKQARSISAGTDVTISGLGDATATYSVSGITAYAKGIKYNDVYYAGNGESVSLTLSHGDKAGYAFNQYAVAGGGTLTAQTETSATLSMTDANQTINATWTPTYTATFADGNDNTGWTIDPASGVQGTTVTVSYEGENKVKSVTVQKRVAVGHELSSVSLGEIICSDGLAYAAADRNNLPTGVTASGMVVYLGAAGSVETGNDTYRGMAISLVDAPQVGGENIGATTGPWANGDVAATDVTSIANVGDSYSTAVAELKGIANTANMMVWWPYAYKFAHHRAHSYAVAKPSGTSDWFEPTLGQWARMMDSFGGSFVSGTYDTKSAMAVSNLNTALTNAGGTALSADQYWLSTEINNSEAAYFSASGGQFGYHGKDTSHRVRAFFAF